MRYIEKNLQKDLVKKMIILAGPRQSGKTTIAQALMDSNSVYLNWDIPEDRRLIKEKSWSKTSSLIVLDEIHKASKWKNFLKSITDEFHNKPPILVTGSAKLDAFRRSGDALTGRHFFYRLHPFDLKEVSQIDPSTPSHERLEKLLEYGGFPEAYLNPSDAARLRKDRMELVIKEDLRELTHISNWRGPQDLIEILRDQVGSSVKYDGLKSDLSVTSPTVKNWVELLEKLYIIFTISPYFKNITSSIRKEKKVYFYDSGAAYDETKGRQLENVVACSLLKYCHFRQDVYGENIELFYLRDKQQHEVDFALVKNRKVDTLIEVKKSEAEVSKGLKYFTKKLKPRESIQLVVNLRKPKEHNGIKTLPLIPWIENLSYKSSHD